MRAAGKPVSIVDPGARSETTEVPGARISGLVTPCSLSEPDHEGTVSSLSLAVPWGSVAPTVITKGSWPGEVTVPLPMFHAATTTVRPDDQAASTAADSGSFSYRTGASTPSERLSTEAPTSSWCTTTQ